MQYQNTLRPLRQVGLLTVDKIGPNVIERRIPTGFQLSFMPY